MALRLAMPWIVWQTQVINAPQLTFEPLHTLFVLHTLKWIHIFYDGAWINANENGKNREKEEPKNKQASCVDKCTDRLFINHVVPPFVFFFAYLSTSLHQINVIRHKYLKEEQKNIWIFKSMEHCYLHCSFCQYFTTFLDLHFIELFICTFEQISF